MTNYVGSDGNLDVLQFLTLLSTAIKNRSVDVIDYRNKHWERQHVRCHPCFIHYDYIAKLETLDSDMKYILNFFNSKTIPHRNRSTSKPFNITITSVDEILHKLNKDVINILTEYYRYDFDLFSYKVNITRDSGGIYVETGQGMC